MNIDRPNAGIELTAAEAAQFDQDAAFRKTVLDKANDLSDSTDRTVLIFDGDGRELGTFNAEIGEFRPTTAAPAALGVWWAATITRAERNKAKRRPAFDSVRDVNRAVRAVRPREVRVRQADDKGAAVYLPIAHARTRQGALQVQLKATGCWVPTTWDDLAIQ